MARTRVYISSTFADLKDHRAKVIEMLEKSGDDVECMEKYAAADERPQDKCRQDASSCDVYVCFLAWRYGFIPKQDNPGGKSITELEYEAAPKGRRLSFQLNDDAPWSPSLMDSGTNKGKRGKLIKDFRARAGNEAINDFFTTPDDLAVKVLAAVRKLETERRDVISSGQTRWLQEYAQKLEASFFAHLCQQQRPDRAEAETRYIEVLVCERPKDQGSDKEAEVEPRPLSDLAAQSGLRALVLGAGGSGKTSLLRKLASDYCRRALVDTQAPLPFFARLNFFDTHTDVLNGLLNVVAREAELSRDDLFHLWSHGSRRCLFLLDGLNEVRPEFSADCRLALQRLTEQPPHTYLISSRSSDQAAELQRQLGGILEVEVLHLDTDQIKTYLQRIGAGDLCNRMEDRLLSLAQNPFLLWAIVKSCVGLAGHELPRNVGQLYENLIDGYIFGKREVSKPQESRPTRYNYPLVKKSVLARLAVEMCQQGTTRMPEDNARLESIRGHLYELRDSNAGIRLLQPHMFMPEPFATELLDECVANGILQRSSSTLEFMHESVRDYFAAVELSEWPVEQVLQNVSPLIWRHVEPGYYEWHLEGTLVQAVIMSAGLRADAGNLLQQLVDHHPLLAAHCFAGARDIAPELEEDLVRRWLSLLDHRLTRYRWVGCQCLRAARVPSAELARRLFEVIRSDSAWEVRKSAARGFAGINDAQLTKDLVAQAVNDIPEHDYGKDNLGEQFRHLQTDTLVVELLVAWGDPTQTDARKRRVEQLFAKMRRSSVRQALQRLAGQAGSAKPGEARVSQLAQAALDVLDSWKASGMLHAEDVRESMHLYARQFQTEISKWSEEMSTWPRADIASALKDSCAEKRAAAARSLASRKIEAIAELVEAFARERRGQVSPILAETLRALGQPDVLYVEWETRIRDQRWPLLFSVGPDFADDLANRNLSERWTNEFKQHQTELNEHSYLTPREQGWMIYPGSYGGKLHHNPVYWLRQGEGEVEVFDAGMRPRLVAVAEMIGPRAMPVLKELLAEKDEFLQIEAAETLGKIATPDAVVLLSECLSQADRYDAVRAAAIKGLEETHSKQAIQPLIEALRTSGSAQMFGGEVGRAIGALNGVGNLVQFAHETGMRGDEHCRLATVSALSSCGHQGPEIEELLLRAASDAEPRVRRAAVAGLGGITSPRAEQKLLTICLEDLDEGIRAAAGSALRLFPGDAGLPKLVTTLESGKDEICIRAAEALALIQDNAAIPALTKLMESNLPLTRIAAAKALGALGFNQAETLIQVLCPLARTAPDIMARQEAATALREISGGEATLYQPIKEALTNGRYDEVVQLIGPDTPFLPDDANLYWWRGLARHSLERWQDALTDLDQAIAMTDCDAVVHTTRAEVLAELNRFPDALAAAEKAAEIEPEEAMNHFSVGWYAYQAKELEKSVTASRHALELNPKLAIAEFNLGLALLASGQRLEAIDAYNRGIVLCAEFNKESAITAFDGASGDPWNALSLPRVQLKRKLGSNKLARRASIETSNFLVVAN